MSETAKWQIGQRVKLSDGRLAIIRYIGDLHFSTGEWIGVELEDSSGKNDGCAKGQRYFKCAQGHGMFLRSTMIARATEMQSSSISRQDRLMDGQSVKRRSSGIIGPSSSRVSRHLTSDISITVNPANQSFSRFSHSYSRQLDL